MQMTGCDMLPIIDPGCGYCRIGTSHPKKKPDLTG